MNDEEQFVEVRLIKDGEDHGTVVLDRRRMRLLYKSVACEWACSMGYTWEEVKKNDSISKISDDSEH